MAVLAGVQSRRGQTVFPLPSLPKRGGHPFFLFLLSSKSLTQPPRLVLHNMHEPACRRAQQLRRLQAVNLVPLFGCVVGTLSTSNGATVV